MFTLDYTVSYLRARKKYVRNNNPKARALNKTLSLFVNNPLHPSLKLEKLGGTEILTKRINKGDRIFFVWKNEKIAILLDVGLHDSYGDY